MSIIELIFLELFIFSYSFYIIRDYNLNRKDGYSDGVLIGNIAAMIMLQIVLIVLYVNGKSFLKIIFG